MPDSQGLHNPSDSFRDREGRPGGADAPEPRISSPPIPEKPVGRPTTSLTSRERGGIVIPCYNHAESVAAVVSEVRSVVPDLPVVVVDDGSNPRVEPIPGVEIVSHSSNMGKGAAILSGIDHFHDRDYIVLVDADGQHPVDEIPQLLAAFEESPKADIVTSSRDLIHDVTIPMRHRIANLVLSMEFALLFGRFIRDVTNGFRVIRIRSLLGIDARFRGYEVEIETLRSMLKNGLVVRSVPTRGVRYDAPSSLGRGFRITATLALSMLDSKFTVHRAGKANRREHPLSS